MGKHKDTKAQRHGERLKYFVRALCLCAFVSLCLHAQESAPLTLAQVREMIGTLPDAAVRRYINDRKVDFELTTEIENEFKKRNVSQDILDLIRIRRVVPKAAVEITCKPVDCEVFFNNSRIGMTTQGRLTKIDEDPLKVTVLARAPGFNDQSAVLQLVANQTSRYDFTLERVPAPPPPPPPVQPKPVPVQPPPQPAKPEPTPTPPAAPVETATLRDAAPAKPDAVGPQQLFNRILEACGGVAALNLTKFTATGSLTLVGRGAPYEATLTEQVSYPNGLRWQMRVAGVEWYVATGPVETWSDGDAKYRGSEIAQDLERNIKSFVSLHLPALFKRLQETGVRHSMGPNTPDGQQVLISQTSDDKWTITLDSSLRPVRVVHETLTGLTQRTEMAYGRYETQVNRAVLPMSMTLRNSLQPNFGHEVRYTKIDTATQPGDNRFRRGGLLDRFR